MWTNENRGRYERSGLRYPSDLTNEEWALVEPLIRPAKRGGNRRHVVVREVVNGSHEGSSVNRFLPMPIRGELSFPQGIPANLTSGGITIPATVPHSGRESFEGTAPLFKTTLGATPRIGDVPSDHRTAMPSRSAAL